MSNESNQWMEDKINEELEQIFNGQTSITKEKMKQALEEIRMRPNGGRGRGGRGGGGGGRGGMDRSSPMQEEMKEKVQQLLETELNKITSNTITKEQAKSALLSFRKEAKDQWHAQKDEYMQSSIQEEFTKLNTNEVSANQARDIFRNIKQKMRPPSHGGGPSMLDDNIKHEFLNEFKTKHGANKISVDEAWEMIKCFDKKQHDKMGCCEKNSESEKDKDKKFDEIFNEQYKELFGDVNKTKINQQQLADLGKKIKEKLRQECPQHPGKRFCQH